MLNDGSLSYIGRSDDQIKICGKRVNLNEIYYPSFINKAYCILSYKVINIHTKKILAIAKTKITFFDIKKRKVTKIPEPFKLVIHDFIS